MKTITKSLLNLFLVLVGLFGMAPSAIAVATFHADLSVSLTFPPPVVNTFGYAVLLDGWGLPGATAIGNANAQAAPPTNNYGMGVLTFTAGPVDGWAGAPFGQAIAVSVGDSHSINLANLTGSGPPTPPAQIFHAVFGGNYTYNLSTTIAGANESARAEFSFQILNVTTNQIIYGPKSDFVTGNQTQAGVVGFAFAVPLPANSITKIRIDPYVTGWATASEVPPPPPPPPPPIPIPEPSTLFLLSSGLAGIIGLRRKRLLK
jgi:hypothetical protein